VIKGFADKETRKLFGGFKSRAVPQDVRERAESKLAVLDAAKSLEDLKVPPGNRLEALRGDREGAALDKDQYAVPGVLCLGQRSWRRLRGGDHGLPRLRR
jgi:hypothetical protein